MLFDEDLILKIRQELRIISQPVGTRVTTPNQNKLLSVPARLGSFEERLLKEHGIKSYNPRPNTAISDYSFKILKNLWDKGLYFSSGSKFGCNCLVYRGLVDFLFVHLYGSS